MEFNFSPPTSRVSRGLQTFAVVLVWVQRDFFFFERMFSFDKSLVDHLAGHC